MVLASALKKETMPISRAELAARLIHRKFWFLGLFLSVPGVLACFDPQWPNLI
jgi:hypothetical protein